MIRGISVISAFLLLAVFAIQGCGIIGPSLDPDSREFFEKDKTIPPGWATNLPQSDIYYYAVGWSGPCYKPSKTRDQAIERAIQKLAGIAKTHVKNQSVLWEDKDKVRASDSLTDISIEGIVSGAEVVAERYVLDDKVKTIRPGTVYVLMRIPKSELNRN